MENARGDAFTERHLALFGAILQWFASYELTIEQAIAGVLQTDPACVAILTRQLDFSGKRAALLDLMRCRSIPSDHWERVFAYLAVPNSRIGLRDHIAHSTWMTSPEPKSIQPNWILRQAPRIGPTRLGPEPADSSYTLDMLTDVVTDLAESHERFLAYLTEARLIRTGA